MASSGDGHVPSTRGGRSCIILYTVDPDYFNTPPEKRPLRRQEHFERVAALSKFLRDHGVDCIIDEYVKAPDPPASWPRWYEEEIENRDCVLLVLTPFFYSAYTGGNAMATAFAEGIDPADKESLWSFQMVRTAANAVYGKLHSSLQRASPASGQNAEPTRRRDFCVYPIFFDRTDEQLVPSGLRSGTLFCLQKELCLEGDVGLLYRCLTGQASHEQPQLAKIQVPIVQGVQETVPATVPVAVENRTHMCDACSALTGGAVDRNVHALASHPTSLRSGVVNGCNIAAATSRHPVQKGAFVTKLADDDSGATQELDVRHHAERLLALSGLSVKCNGQAQDTLLKMGSLSLANKDTEKNEMKSTCKHDFSVNKDLPKKDPKTSGTDNNWQQGMHSVSSRGQPSVSQATQEMFTSKASGDSQPTSSASYRSKEQGSNFKSLPKSTLSSYLTDIQASQLAKFIGADWRTLGQVLGIKEYELRAVEHDRQQARDRAMEVLHRWRQRVGRRVRLSKLVKELQTDPTLEEAMKLFAEYLQETMGTLSSQ